jgi:hypothetical protein
VHVFGRELFGSGCPGTEVVRARKQDGEPADPRHRGHVVQQCKVNETRQEGLALLNAPGEMVRGAKELALRDPDPDSLDPAQLALDTQILNTLLEPNAISVGASQLRMEAAARVGVLKPALDASVSAKASNWLEIMLCHQLAATHHAAMRLFALAGQAASAHDAAQIARLMNAAARQMDSYQAGMLALMKFKAAGKQTVIVHHQHVTVADGGQAVIAASMKTGGSRREGRRPKK